LIKEIEEYGEVSILNISHDGKEVFSLWRGLMNDNSGFNTWTFEGDLISEVEFPFTAIELVFSSNNDQYLVIKQPPYEDEGEVRLYDLDSNLLGIFNNQRITSVNFSPDLYNIIISSENGSLEFRKTPLGVLRWANMNASSLISLYNLRD
jgi:WD40 repeat protein